MQVNIEPGWHKLLSDEFGKPYFAELAAFVKSEYANQQIFPPGKLIFNAFDQCPFDKVKVVILGQDPYHGPGQAHGLCFSVPHGVSPPGSLQNIFKELNADMGLPIPKSGNLEHWAHQGVFLLNTTLTVRAHQPGSHQNRGWETFTNEVIHLLADKKQHVVFMLWGAFAQQKGLFIDQSKHLVLKSVHPSPLSAHRGFFGNHHFIRANQYLLNNGIEPVYW